MYGNVDPQLHIDNRFLNKCHRSAQSNRTRCPWHHRCILGHHHCDHNLPTAALTMTLIFQKQSRTHLRHYPLLKKPCEKRETEEKKMVSTIQNNNWISVNYSPATPTLALIFDRGHGIFFRSVDTWWEYHILRKFSHVVTTMLKIRVLIFKSHVLIVKLIRC